MTNSPQQLSVLSRGSLLGVVPFAQIIRRALFKGLMFVSNQGNYVAGATIITWSSPGGYI